VMPGGGGRDNSREASHDGRVTALSSRAEVSGTTALKTEPERRLSPAEQLEAQIPFAKPDPKAAAAARRAEAKAKGYEGEMCSECMNFTLVRNGTCLKCDTCGSTTGCS
jgi:ribonucleoside-diphosphate reductase alpha chain